MGQRCGHEQKMHEASCFFTLTYDDEHVPADYSVKLRDWQLFLKRTRKRTRVKGLRFAGGGEYGELGLRPHYHGLFFNYDFPTRSFFEAEWSSGVLVGVAFRALGEQGVDRAWFGDARQRGLRGALLDEEGDRQEGR